MQDAIAAIREDVAYIKAKVEVLPDLEGRVRSLERTRWSGPGSALAAVLALIGSHFGGN